MKTFTTAYSLSFNEARYQGKGAWQGKVKAKDGKGWITKWLPQNITRNQTVEAERWLLGWYGDYLKTGDNTPAVSVAPTSTTIALLSDRWLNLRYNHTRTAANTYRGLRQCMTTWILDNKDFPHVRIQHLNIHTDFTVELIRKWINSINAGNPTKLSVMMCLRTFFRDCIAEGWITPAISNPMMQSAILDMFKDHKETIEENKVINVLEPAQIEFLLSSHQVPDYRKLRYLLALCTGCRDHEIQALTWKDIDFKNNIMHIQRQLDKIGCLPSLYVSDLVREGKSKNDIYNMPNAVVSNPKRNSKRDIPMHHLLAQSLTWWKEKGYRQFTTLDPVEDGPVFARGVKGKPPGKMGDYFLPESALLLRQDVQRMGTTIDASNAASERLVFHTLRHTFSSMLDSVGLERQKISELLGHGKRTVLQKSYLVKHLPAYQAAIDAMPLPATIHFASVAIGI